MVGDELFGQGLGLLHPPPRLGVGLLAEPGGLLLGPPGQLAGVRLDALAQLPSGGLRSLHHALGMLAGVEEQALALVQELLGPDHLPGN